MNVVLQPPRRTLGGAPGTGASATSADLVLYGSAVGGALLVGYIGSRIGAPKHRIAGAVVGGTVGAIAAPLALIFGSLALHGGSY
jgi:hypothetical protein